MTNNPTIDGVSRELLERLLTDACNENWSELKELLHAPAACRCRRFGKDNPHWPCPVHSAQADQLQGDQQVPTAAMTEAGCQAYMDADGMIGIMHNSSMGHAYTAMRALDPELATLQSRIDQLEAESMCAAATYQAARARIEELESGPGEPVAWRGLNAGVEVVTEWIDGIPPERMTDLCGNAASFDKIERAYAAPPDPVAPDKYDDVLLPFLALMRAELHANAHKGDRPGWLQMDSKAAILEVFYHMGKLHQAVHRGEEAAIKEYAADVANMCMMLLDVCACLDATAALNGGKT